MVAGWIIGAGGGIGSYGRNVNQTAQRGAQGAYTGSKAMAGGAQVLLPVMSFDVSKGHSLKGSKFPPVETFARRLVCILFVNSLYNRELFCIFEH